MTFPGGLMVRSKLVVAALAGGVVLAGLAGCNSGSGVGATTSDSAPATTTSSAPKSEISHPLDLTKYAADVCTGLTDSQVTVYTGAIGKKNPGSGSNGPDCTFVPANTDKPAVGLGVENIATPTQDLLYQSLEQFPWRQKISPIAGYPAADSSTARDSQSGYCNTNVSLNDKQSVQVQFQDAENSDPYYTKPCTVTEALAAEVIQNIQAGGA